MSPARLVLLLVASAWALTLALPAAAGGAFVDDDGSVHEADIEAIAAAGVTKGCNPPDNDRFCPDDPVTRGEMAAFLVRALGLPSATTSGFVDVAGHLFEEDIARVAAAGVTKGCNPPDNDRFCPDDPVTREQMASFLVRAFDYPPGEPGRFVDTASSVHAADIDALAAAGVTKGCNPPDNDRFCPTDLVSRAQMASFLARAMGLTGVFGCTEVIGFSQTGGNSELGKGWFQSGFETQPGIDDGEWQLRWDSGAGIERIADPADEIWTRSIGSACTSGPVDRVVVQISHSTISTPTVEQFAADIAAAVVTIRDKHPAVERIDLMPVIGGPDHAVCPSPSGSGDVRASVNHPVIDEAIAGLVGDGVIASISPEVGDCSWYRDKPGHLHQFASDAVAADIAAWYAG